MHFSLPPLRRPRHPLARALSLVLGVAVLGVLLVFGLVVAGVLLVGGIVLLAVPLIMVAAFLAVAFSPVLLVLGGIQVARRVAEYAVAKPSRDMLFTVVDQQAKYKAKNVIDTVVYRFGDLTSSWLSAAVLPFGVAGLAMLGIAISVIWFPIAWMLGRRYENVRDGAPPATAAPVE